MSKVRIDKWLWSVRVYKTRTQAADACRESKVRVGGEAVKPAFMLGINDEVTIKREGFNLTYKVLDTIEKRVSAPLAQKCYHDLTPPEERNKFEAWFAAATQFEFRERGTGRPTKRDRRDIDEFKNDD